MNRIEKIVSHKAPRHVDDALAVALLVVKYPDAALEFVHPQKVPNEYIENPSIILVDVGGDFNPELRNYDHHQDTNISFSLYLVLKHEFPEYYDLIQSDPRLKQEFDYLDIKDRFGYQKAKESFPGIGSLLIQETLMLKMAETEAGIKMLGQVFKAVLDEKLHLKKALDSIEIHTVDGLKVLVDKTGIRAGEVFAKHPDAHILIQRNAMNKDQTSVIKNTNNPDTSNIDLAKVKNKYPTVFIHKAGFIAVLDMPIDEAANKVEDIVRTVAGE